MGTNIIEEKYKELFKKFEEEAKTVITNTHSELYTELLPWMVSDTENNIDVICRNLIKTLLEGSYEIDEDGRIPLYTEDGFCCSINFSKDFSKLSATLAERHKDIIQNEEIKRLEKELKEIKVGINEWLRHF